jgi:putative transposase
MPKALNFTLSTEDLEQIAHAIKHDTRPEVRQRAIGLRLLHEGHGPAEVAKLMEVSMPTVYSWHHRFQTASLEGLANRPKSGRKPKATMEYLALLEKLLEQDPQDIGYAFTFWTADRLRLHLEKQTGILLSANRFRALLKANEYVYRRPKHDLKNLQDPEARQNAEAWLEELKKEPKMVRSTFSLWTKPD